MFKPHEQPNCGHNAQLEEYLRRLGVFFVQSVVLFALLLVLIVVFLQLLPHGINVVLLHQLVLRERGGDMKSIREQAVQRNSEIQDEEEGKGCISV